MSVGICPADDIGAAVITSVAGVQEVGVHAAVLPPEDNFKSRIPEISDKGRKIV